MNANPIVSFEPLMSMDGACEALRVTRWQLRSMIVSDGLPFVMVGKRRKFRPESLRLFLEQRTSEVAV